MPMKQPRYYGWTIALTLAITETISYGIMFYAFSVFLAPMEVDLGWSRTQITGALSLALLVSAAMAYPVGYWVDRYGARLLMTVGSVLGSVLVVAWSQVTSLTAFYLIWIGLGICFSAVFYEPAFAVIAHWFVKRRSQALALITLVAGFASTIFLPLSDWLLQAFGWRNAVLILGIGLAITTIPLHFFVLRQSPESMGLLPDGEPQTATTPLITRTGATLYEATHSITYWQIIIAFSFSALAAGAIRVHFIPFLIESGIHSTRAAALSGMIGFMQVAGRLIFAPLDDRLSARVMVGGVFGVQVIAMMVLLLGTHIGWISLFIVLFGTSYGALTLARPSIVAQLYGAAHYGRINSVIAIFLTVAGTIAPVGAGWLFDRAGSYQPMVYIIIFLALLSVGMTLIMKPYQMPAPRTTT